MACRVGGIQCVRQQGQKEELNTEGVGIWSLTSRKGMLSLRLMLKPLSFKPVKKTT
jgi:hypothetical protein